MRRSCHGSLGTALLHSAVVVEKRETLKGWTVFLAILAFGLSLLGTFLVRSGVLTSVHAFATDPHPWRFHSAVADHHHRRVVGAVRLARTEPARGRPVSSRSPARADLLLNNLLLTTATATVLLGTLYPLMLEAVDGGKVSVGPPFFNAVFVPLADSPGRHHDRGRTAAVEAGRTGRGPATPVGRGRAGDRGGSGDLGRSIG